jgi:hypothetical protein
MSVQISINNQPPTTLDVPPGWADYTIPLPPGAGDLGDPDRTLTLEITSPTLSPAALVSGSNDSRTLGVGLDYVQLNK